VYGAQAKAWADRSFSLAWLNNTLAAHLLERELHEGERPKTLVICDNLDSHIFGGFLEGLKSLGAERNLLIAGETEMLQAIDGGIGSILKMVIAQVLSLHNIMYCYMRSYKHNDMWLNLFVTAFKIQDTWLDDSANFDAWEVALLSYFNF
jgi:hypothetical protein